MDVQYVIDSTGNIRAVQLPFSEWKKVLQKLNRYEQMLKVRSDLTEAFKEVEVLRKSKAKKQTLREFLGEL